METPPLEEGSIPHVDAPQCLSGIMLKLESERSIPFPHELQYKKPFRELCKETQEASLTPAPQQCLRWSRCHSREPPGEPNTP